MVLIGILILVVVAIAILSLKSKIRTSGGETGRNILQASSVFGWVRFITYFVPLLIILAIMSAISNK